MRVSEPPDEIDVYVTAAHIEAGIKGNTCECPLALALFAAGYEDVSVDLDMDVDGCTYRSREAADFICAFDQSAPVQPCRIMLSRVTP